MSELKNKKRTKDQPTKAPTKKVQAGLAGGALASLILAGLDHVDDFTWLTDHPFLLGLVVTVGGFVAAWLKRSEV